MNQLKKRIYFLIFPIFLFIHIQILAQKKTPKSTVKKAIKSAPIKIKNKVTDIPEETLNTFTALYQIKNIEANGKFKNIETQKILLSKLGECLITNEDAKFEQRTIYKYGDSMAYILNVNKKYFTKKTVLEIQKKITTQSKTLSEPMDTNDTWKSIGEMQIVNGYNCYKISYTSKKDKTISYDVWLCSEVKIKTNANRFINMSLGPYKIKANTVYKELKNAIVIRLVLIKKGIPYLQKDLKEFKKSSDDKYFDLTNYKLKKKLSIKSIFKSKKSEKSEKK